jgi:hypothetical protein
MSGMTVLRLLVVLAAVATPPVVSAQCIDVTLENWDYGDVNDLPPRADPV